MPRSLTYSNATWSALVVGRDPSDMHLLRYVPHATGTDTYDGFYSFSLYINLPWDRTFTQVMRHLVPCT